MLPVLGRIALHLGRARAGARALRSAVRGGQLVEHKCHTLNAEIAETAEKLFSLRTPRALRSSSSSPGHRRQKRDFVAVVHSCVHPRVVGVDRARNRPLVAGERRKLAGELAPDRADRRARRRRRACSSAAPAMSRSRANSRTVTRMPPARPPRARARRPDRPWRLRSRRRRRRRTRASRSARSASRARSRSGTPRNASAAMRRRGAIATLASPISSRPIRWCSASRTPGQRPAISSAIRSNAFSASGSYASYSRYCTRRPSCGCAPGRETSTTAPSSRPSDSRRRPRRPAARARARPGRWPEAESSPSQYTSCPVIWHPVSRALIGSSPDVIRPADAWIRVCQK